VKKRVKEKGGAKIKMSAPSMASFLKGGDESIFRLVDEKTYGS